MKYLSPLIQSFDLSLEKRETADSWVGATPWLMIFVAVAIGLIGVGALYSAAHGAWQPWALMHAIRLALGLLAMAIVALLPIRFIRRFALLWWLIAIAALGMLEFFGTGKGADRWFALGGITLQPSEPAKLAVLVMLAAYFHELSADRMRQIRSYIPVLLIVFLPFAQIVLQPDLGTAVMLFLAAAVVIFVAGIPRWMVMTLMSMGLAAIPVAWSMLYAYQKNRILVFLNPDLDALGAGYQITQSKIALGSGGFVGKGYLQGSQSHLEFLPERQTDFIFTMIGEEFGFMGCMIVLGLYTLLVFLLIYYSFQMRMTFSRLITIGVAATISFYVSINTAMVSGLLPVVGVPLPLISYGGTAMMVVFLGLGLVISAMLNEHDIHE